MKKTILFAAVAAIFCSCGASKQVAPTYNAQLQAQPQQSAPVAQAQPQPTVKARTMRQAEPCEELAAEREFAAAGTATSYTEKVARNEAIRDARYELGRMMKATVEGAAEDYLRNVTHNGKSTSESISEEINNQFFSECVKNSKVIKTTVYDLPDGQIQVYACVEVVAKFDVLDKIAETAQNVLSRDAELTAEFDKERFKDNIKDKMKEYKEKNQK